MIDENSLQRIAAAAHALRPDWPTKSLVTYLHAKHADRPIRDLAVAVTWIACDPTTRTPKRLEEAGPWWLAAVADGQPEQKPTPSPDPIQRLTCRRCGRLTPRGLEHGPADCTPRNPATYAAGAAAAKAAIKAPPKPTEETP